MAQTPYCCWLNQETLERCPNDAEWEIWGEPWEKNPDPYNCTHACTTHVGYLLGDFPRHYIVPIGRG